VNKDPCHGTAASDRGFSLIEVIAALVIFSTGVLMVLRLTTALSARMEYSATASEVAVRSQERLDSLESLPFDSLALGTTADTLTIQGAQYVRTVVVTSVTGILYQIQVTTVRMDGEAGPSSAATSYAAGHW
jgi:prepilin-type N-terminal cleavage/methylation domain-containing protein